MAEEVTRLLDSVLALSERIRILEERIGERPIGNDVIAPAYAAPIGTAHFDSVLQQLWVNFDATAIGWVLVGGGGAFNHTILDASVHTDSALDVVSRGSLIYGNATPLWDELAHPAAASRLLTTDANDVLWSAYSLVGTAGQTYTFSATGGTVPTGSGVANQVVYWATATTLAGDADVTFNPATSTFQIAAAGVFSSLGAGINSEKFGLGAAAAGQNATAVGNGASAAGLSSFAGGLNASAGFTSSTATGASSNAGAISVSVYGNQCALTGARSCGYGQSTTGSGTDQALYGWAVVGGAFNNVSIFGRAGSATGNDATGVGRNITVAANGTGVGTSANIAAGAVGLGKGVAPAANTFQVDCNTVTVITADATQGTFPAWLGLGGATAATMLELEEMETLAASPADGYAAAITLDPGYTAAFTVTRHNYIDVQDVSLAGGAAVTDACIMRFDAAAGTHKAVDAGTTKTTPGTVNAWPKININGTIYYIPAYTSKTA